MDWTAQLKNKKNVRDIADWCRRELETARRTGSLETRPFVQNADLIIAALDHIGNPLLTPEHPDALAALECWSIVEQLRAPEGAQVTLICDNPDFNEQPNSAVEIIDDWTGWKATRFQGESILECLRGAKLLRDRTQK